MLFFVTTGEHGLVSAVSEDSFQLSWGLPLVVNGADGLTIGTGVQNAIDIVNTCSSSTSGFAADLCDKLELNCFDDWLLPSKVELDRLYQNREKVNETAKANGGNELEDTEYWSSSHQYSNTMFAQYFTAGNQSGFSEDELLNVRAIGAF